MFSRRTADPAPSTPRRCFDSLGRAGRAQARRDRLCFAVSRSSPRRPPPALPSDLMLSPPPRRATPVLLNSAAPPVHSALSSPGRARRAPPPPPGPCRGPRVSGRTLDGEGVPGPRRRCLRSGSAVRRAPAGPRRQPHLRPGVPASGARSAGRLPAAPEFGRWKVNNLAVERRDFLSSPLPVTPEFIRNIRMLGKDPAPRASPTISSESTDAFLLSATLGR
ncbi:hypothetical protein WMY93_024303 [Mugilogobius chulae]|uniref:Uncharacterized protein n=1 Tax=Mugilogobius chulae TaxID=88201 RepID=A0AAW0N078_9GOBI